MRGPLGAVLLAILSSLPAVAHADQGPAACLGLRDLHTVSFRGREDAIYARIVETTERVTGKRIQARRVVVTFGECLETLRLRGRDASRETLARDVDHPPLPAIPDALTGLAWRVDADVSTLCVSLTGAPQSSDCRSIREGDDLPRLAKSITRGVVRRAHARRAAADRLADAMWFLWIESTVRSLESRFNGYTYADELAEERALSRGKSFSVGFEPSFRDSTVRIARVLDERLERAGVQIGAQVLALDGKPVTGMKPGRLIGYFLGPEPFRYSIEVEKDGHQVRATGEAMAVRHRTMTWATSRGQGYLRIARFAEDSLVEIRRALREIEHEGARGIVVDLRGNSGGRLSVGLVDCFLKPGQTAVSYQDMRAGFEPVDIDATVEYHGLPLVVLVDGESASMAETFAAAMQTHKRGTIVGQRTFGKGVGQTVIPILDEGALLLVDRVYYYPGTRRTWNEAGIEPDVPVELDDEELEGPPDVDGVAMDLEAMLGRDRVLARAFQILETSR